MAKGLYRRALLLILGGALLPSGWLRFVSGGGGHASSVLARAGAPAAAILSCVGNQHARSEGHSEHELRPSHLEVGMLRLRGGAGEPRKSGAISSLFSLRLRCPPLHVCILHRPSPTK